MSVADVAGKNSTVSVVPTDAAEWGNTRERMVQRFIGVSADEFEQTVTAGVYANDPPAVFPELD